MKKCHTYLKPHSNKQTKSSDRLLTTYIYSALRLLWWIWNVLHMHKCCLYKESQRVCLGGITVGRPPSVPFLFTFHIHACWILCIRLPGNTREIHVPMYIQFSLCLLKLQSTDTLQHPWNTLIFTGFIYYLFSHWFTLETLSDRLFW